MIGKTYVMQPPDTYPRLSRSYRGRFAFRLATTSYIYPDRILPNVQALAPFFDEIEILLFEKDSPPSSEEILQVKSLLKAEKTTANVHLPLDIDLAARDAERRKRDAAVTRLRIEETLPWRPTTYCLHIGPAPKHPDMTALEKWRRRAAGSLGELLRAPVPSRRITVETLDYPFSWVEPLVEEFNLSICADLGHLFVHGFEPLALFERLASRIEVIHLHGVSGGRDHLPLNRMDPCFLPATRRILSDFTGVVSLEGFSLDFLENSTTFLEELLTGA
jgi:sugar phosphate isomerase/epimerase